MTPPAPSEPADGSPQWRVTLWTMVAVQLIMSAAFTFLNPVLPLFLPHLGVDSLREVEFWSGLLASMTSFIAAFAAPIWGKMSDRLGRKPMVLRSAFAIGVCTLLMGFSQSVWQLLALRALMGAFAGFTSSSVVLVASQVPERRLGYSLSLLSTGQLVGSLMGPVLGGGLADLTGSYRQPFFVAGAVSLIAFALCWRMVPERFTPPKEKRRGTTMLASFRMMLRIPGLPPLVLVLLLTQFAVQAIAPIVTLFVQEMVGPQPNLATLGGLAFSVTGLAGVIAVPLLGRSSDRFGERRVLLITLAGAALMTIPQAFVSNYWVFVAERFTPPKEKRKRTTMLASIRMMIRIPGMAPLVLVLLLAQFAVQAIAPIVTLFVQDMIGPQPNLATLGGVAFSVTGLAGVIAVPLLGRASDRFGERIVLLLTLAGAALMTVPQAFVENYGLFVAERFGVGLFVGGILPAANALIGKKTPAAERGAIFGMTASAYFFGNFLGPITGGAVAARFGFHWVFLLTAILLCLNLAWVYVSVHSPREPYNQKKR